MEQSNAIDCSLTNEDIVERLIQFELDGMGLKELEQYFYENQRSFYDREPREALLDYADYYELDLT